MRKKMSNTQQIDGKRTLRMHAGGMSARMIVMPYEDDLEYHEVRAGLIKSYAPANNQEFMLVDQIAAGYWRTMRVRAFEREMFTAQVRTRKIDNGLATAPNSNSDDLATAVVLVKEPQESFATYFRYDASIERAYYRAISALERMQSGRKRQEQQQVNRAKEPQGIAATASKSLY